MPFSTLETARLDLRPFVPGDAEAVHAYRRDPEVMRFAGGPDRSLEDTRRTIEEYCRCQRRYGFSKWAVLMKGTGDLVGDSGLLPMNDVPEFELGYRLAKRFWSRGFATECGQAWLRAAFARLNLRHVFAHCDERHEASIRVMRKLGMAFDRRARIGGIDCSVYRIDGGNGRRAAWTPSGTRVSS